MSVHIHAYNNYLVFSVIDPACSDYGVAAPIYTFYDDGSFSRQQRGHEYYRSPANKLRKPWNEYTLSDLYDIATESVKSEVSKEFAEKVYKEVMKAAKDKLSGMLEFQPLILIKAMSEYCKPDTEWSMRLTKLENALKIMNKK